MVRISPSHIGSHSYTPHFGNNTRKPQDDNKELADKAKRFGQGVTGVQDAISSYLDPDNRGPASAIGDSAKSLGSATKDLAQGTSTYIQRKASRTAALPLPLLAMVMSVCGIIFHSGVSLVNTGQLPSYWSAPNEGRRAQRTSAQAPARTTPLDGNTLNIQPFSVSTGGEGSFQVSRGKAGTFVGTVQGDQVEFVIQPKNTWYSLVDVAADQLGVSVQNRGQTQRSIQQREGARLKPGDTVTVYLSDF